MQKGQILTQYYQSSIKFWYYVAKDQILIKYCESLILRD